MSIRQLSNYWTPPIPQFLCVWPGRVGWLVLQSRTKSGSWKNLWMRSLSFITPCLLALHTVLHVLITLLIVSYCWGRTIPGLCDKKNGPTSPFRLMSCPQMAAKPFFSSQSQCLPVDKCSPSVSKLSKHSRQPNSWIRLPFICKLKLQWTTRSDSFWKIVA